MNCPATCDPVRRRIGYRRMVAKEHDALDLADRLDEATDLLWSPMVVWEAVAALSRLWRYDASHAYSDVDQFGAEYRLRLVTIGKHEGEMALHAYGTYGKRSGHRAQLNMGDCFAYACAKTNRARLLYKGNDFAMTDIA